MIVSAISKTQRQGYNLSSGMPFYKNHDGETIGDTVFNSLTPNVKKIVPEENLPQIFDNINEWQNFCHKQILGEKLNTVV